MTAQDTSPTVPEAGPVMSRTGFTGPNFFFVGAPKCGTMAFPDVIRGINYLEGGLTSQSKIGSYRFDQIINSIERAYQYWQIQPTNFRLIQNLLWQVFSAPIKAALGFIESSRFTGHTRGP